MPNLVLRNRGERSAVLLRAHARRGHQPELFLEREDYGRRFNLGLHASGQWHMKEGRRERITWPRPAEVFPGYTRAVGIAQLAAVADREDSAPADVALVSVTEDAEPTTFSLVIERPGANLDDSWPGRNANDARSSAASRAPSVPVDVASSPFRSRCSPDRQGLLVPPMLS
ncbi:hypothetical protein AB0K00_50340 [Dactylosporangium sp. NPDC049525]|uniref:hypothetical protein n=1 Tax=Dactylosporangium sp. NPDC049525 TaxID=3154730 RepID=UPI00343EDEC7